MSAWTCGSCGGENPEGMRFCGHCGASAAAVSAEPAPTEADVTSALRSFVAGAVADRLVEAGGELPEERRLITALFADVSGFTSLADRLDPEELLEVIDPVISGLSSIVGRYGGYVEKFAGDALLALFGAPVAHEDDAERALRVALEMHRELARMCENLPHQAELTLHVGVNSGHGIARILGSEARMDYAVLGDSVILAQRLESAAPPGETYVSELTYRLTEQRFDFEPIGELTLKGKSEPVAAWRLVGDRRSSRPEADYAPLVGRREELSLAAGVVDSLATDRRGGVLSVTGDAGIGKSRLTQDIRARAEEAGVRWLDARCLSYGAGLAYWPYIELLRDIAQVRIDDAPDEAAAVVRRAFSHVPEAVEYFLELLALPSGDESPHDTLEPEAFRRRLHTAFAAWLRALASDTPTVLALEDVHWADASSLELTAELAKLTAEIPLALYLVARPEAGATLRQLAPAADLVELGPLQEDAVAELIERTLAGQSPRGFSKVVRDRTQGNPFFVEELVRAYRDSGALVRRDGRWRTRRGWESEALPPTIEGVIAARIDLLPRNPANALQAASVIGRRVRLPLLERTAPELADLSASIDRLVADGFVDRLDFEGEAGFVFHHALVQDVSYSRLLRRRRRDLHRRVAEIAEQLYGAGDDTIDLLARHLYLGEAGLKAVDYLVRAGERARRLFANEEAILHYGRAAEIAPGDVGVALALADVYELVGSYDDALRLYETVRVSHSDVRAWRGIAATLRKQGKYEDALRVVDEAFTDERLRDADVAVIWPEQAWTLTLLGRFDQAIDVLNAGLAAARSRRDTVVGEMLLQLARAETVEGRLQDAVAHGLAAADIFEAAGDVRRLSTALRLLGDAYGGLDRLEDAAAVLRRGLELAQRVGSVEEIGGCLINLGLIEFKRGALDESIACDRQAVEEFERVGHASGRAVAYANLAEKLLAAGDVDEAEGLCESAIALATSIGNTYVLADATNTAAAIQLRQGRFGQAAERAEAAAQLFESIGAKPAAAAALGLAEEALGLAGDPERAREAATRARSLSGASAR